MINLQYLIRNRYRKNSRKAVSPVISTIIIVAIAIAISIAVALYLTGVTSTFTRFERLDVTSAYYDTNKGSVNMTLKNSGTSVLSVDQVLKNGIPMSPNVQSPTSGVQVKLDGTGTNIIQMQQGDTRTFSILGVTGQSGQSLEITLHTASGKEYPKVVQLP